MEEQLTSNKGYLLLPDLPEKPGCYQFFNTTQEIIYVGKARNLKRRVSSYFAKQHDNPKTRLLVSKIYEVKYIVVQTEEDALLLENNLIKTLQPRYNILLKDDKTYPSLCLTNELYPRIIATRHINSRTGEYFGPYSNMKSMHAVLDLINRLYVPRTCKLTLNEEAIAKGHFSVCLKAHIRRCKAPCAGRISHEAYLKDMHDAREILRGNFAGISSALKSQMTAFAKTLQFEEAEEVKQKIELLDVFRRRSQVVSPTITNVDVFSIITDERRAFVNYLHVQDGAIRQGITQQYKKVLGESDEEILSLAIVDLRTRFQSAAKELVVPFEIELPLTDIMLRIPMRGERKQLLSLSELNAKQYKLDCLRQEEKLNPEQKLTRQMKEIQDLLKLPTLPRQIDVFDNSHTAGSDAVSACVVFRSLKPAKQAYRKYIIKEATGGDDYGAMREVVSRRYHRLQEEGGEMPNLILADGGAGQMEVIRQVIEDELHLSIPIGGLAKDRKHRTNELLIGFPPQTVGVALHSETFRLLTRIQDEVHRFAITFHKAKRSQRQVASALDELKGVGTQIKQQLLNRFGSVKRIKEAPIENLQALLGTKRGADIFHQLHINT